MIWHDAGVELSSFHPAHADLIATWPVDAAECLAWCSVESVSGADVASWSNPVDGSGGDIEAWVLGIDGMPAAYGEVWFDGDEDEAELAHVIVAPAHRSTGVGRRLVEALADRGAERFESVIMRVRPDNLAARRCYAAAGFTQVPPAEQAQWNIGQPHAYVWMRR